MFSAGGTVLTSDGVFNVSNHYSSRAGSTLHVDHANVFYQIPEQETGLPMVFLHGYGQSRMGWMTTPDGGRCSLERDPCGKGESVSGSAETAVKVGLICSYEKDIVYF